MSRYLLTIPCPACGNREIALRYHTCGGKRYIDEDLYLHCDKCNDKTFFFDSRFRCNEHNDYREVDLHKLMTILSTLSSFSSGIPDYIIKKLMEKALKYGY